jgi:hypothetical protein
MPIYHHTRGSTNMATEEDEDIDQEMLTLTGVAFSKAEAQRIRQRQSAQQRRQEAAPRRAQAQAVRTQRQQERDRLSAAQQEAQQLRHIPPEEYAQQVRAILDEYQKIPHEILKAQGISPRLSWQLTPERFGRFLSAVDQGMSRKGAANMCGMAQQTFYRWQLNAEQGQPPYEQLFQLLSFAESRIEMNMLASWTRAAATDWKAAQAYLERRFPQEWGARPQVTLTLPSLEQMSDEELESIRGNIIEITPTNPDSRSDTPSTTTLAPTYDPPTPSYDPLTHEDTLFTNEFDPFTHLTQSYGVAQQHPAVPTQETHSGVWPDPDEEPQRTW